jgi:hypothetical protein
LHRFPDRLAPTEATGFGANGKSRNTCLAIFSSRGREPSPQFYFWGDERFLSRLASRFHVWRGGCAVYSASDRGSAQEDLHRGEDCHCRRRERRSVRSRMSVKVNPTAVVMILPNLSVNLIHPAGQPPGNTPGVQSSRVSAVGLSFQSRKE